MKRIVSSWGVSPDVIEVIPSALYPIEVKGTRSELRTQFSYDGIVLTTACRLVPWKGIETIIKLIPQLRTLYGKVSLVVIGDGPYLPVLEKVARDFGVTEHVVFVGRKPKPDMAARIYASDVFVYNTSYEGLSHQLLEVMDIGAPIVTTNIEANLDLIEDGINGVLVTPNDTEEFLSALSRVIENEGLRSALVQHGRMKVKEYAPDEIIKKVITMIREK